MIYCERPFDCERSEASKGVTERKRRHKRDVRCGCQTGRLCVKSFSPAVGGGRSGEVFHFL
jgi:hypothetical protein